MLRLFACLLVKALTQSILVIIIFISKGPGCGSPLSTGHTGLPPANEVVCFVLCRLTEHINKQIFCGNSHAALFLEAAAATSFNSLKPHCMGD